MNIPELRGKIKDTIDRLNTREIYTVLLILVVGFGSFGLGRLSRLEEAKSPIRIEQASAAALSSPPFQGGDRGVVTSPLTKGMAPSSETGVVSPLTRGVPTASSGRGVEEVVSPSLAPGGQLVASKSGTKYHFPWCSGAQRISEANKIWFNSVEEARKARYTPAGNCKGLK